MFSQLFYERNVKWPTIIFSEATTRLVSQYAHFKSDREREEMCMFSLSASVCPYKQWNVNLVLLQKHVYYYVENNTTLFIRHNHKIFFLIVG